MSTTVGGVEIKIGVNADGVASGINKAVGHVSSGMDSIQSAANAVKGYLAAVGFNAFAGYIKSAIDAAGALADLAQKTGISAETLSGLEYAANMSGASLDGVANGLKKLATNMYDTSKGTGDAQEAFKTLGISVTDASGKLRSTDSVMLDVADRFQEMDDGPKKAALAMKIFGKSGEELIPLLNEGSEGIEAMRQRAEELGLTVSDETASAMESLGDKFDTVSMASTGVARQLAAALTPALTSVANSFLETTKKGGLMQGAIAVLTGTVKTLITVGYGAASAFEQVGIMLGAVAAAIANPTKAVDIFKTALTDASAAGDKWGSKMVSIWDDQTPAIAKVTKATDEKTEATKKQVAEAEKQAKKIAEVTGKLDDELAMLKMTNVEAEIYKQLKAAGVSANSAAGQAIAAKVTQLDREKEMLKLTKDAQEASTKATKEHEQALIKETSTLLEKLKKAEQEREQLGLSRVAIEELELSRLREREAMYKSWIQQGINVEMAKKELAAVQNQIGVQTDLIEVLKDTEEALKRNKEAQDAATAVLKLNKDAQEAATRASREHEQALSRETGSLLEKLRKAEQEYEQFGQTRLGIEQLTLARMREKEAMYESWIQRGINVETSKKELAAVQEQIDLQNELIAVLGKTEVQEAQKKSAEDALKAWTDTSKQIEQALTDALMRGFESGKDMVASIRNYIVNAFKSMVVKFIVQPTMGAISGVMGLLSGNTAMAGNIPASGSAGGSMSGLSSISSMVSSAGGLFGDGFMSGLTAWSEGGSVMGLLGQGSNLFAGGMANGLGTIAGALGPIALAATALFALADSFKGEQRSGAQYGYNFGDGVANNRRGTFNPNAALGVNFLEGPSGGEIAGTEVRKSIQTTVDGINRLLSGLGSGSQLIGFQGGLETSERGRGGVFSGGTLTNGVAFGESGRGDNYAGTLFESTSPHNMDAKQALEAFALDLQQSTIQALQSAADIPKSIQDMLTGIDAEALTMDVATSLVGAIEKTVASVGILRDAIEYMPMANLANMSFDAADGLIKLSGGIENLMGQLNSYIAEYYSTDEKLGMQAASISEALTALGLDPSALATRQDFRALVESRDVNTEIGREQLAVLLSIGPQFAQIADYLQENEMSITELIENAPQTNLMRQMLTPAETTANATTAIATNIEDSNAILRQINENIIGMTAATNAAISAAQSASAAAAAAASAASLAASNTGYSYDIGSDGGRGNN